MKTKSLLLGSALSLSLLCGAQAQTYVYMTGSTAFRGSVYTTLNTAGAVFDAAPAVTTRGGSSASGANYMTFVGNIGGSPYVVKCSWSGSEAGIKDVALAPQSQNFLSDTNAPGFLSPAPVPAELVSAVVDLAMGDNSQAFSITKTPAITTKASVGIVPFTFVRNGSTLWGAAQNNITDAQFRQALQGFCRLALFTGNSADTSFVYVSGRNNQSGTRVNCFGIPGFGIFTAPSQIQLDGLGNMIDQGGLVYIGDYGFDSGGTLAGTLGVNTSTKTDLVNGGTGFTVISYLGIGDANKAIGLGATQLTYNGVTQSSANVIEGKHALWGNEFIFKKNGAAAGATTVYNKLASTTTGINNSLDGLTGIKTSDMHATRNGPTSDPVHN